MVEIMCSECAQDIEISTNLIKGEIVACRDCGVELEVVSTDPIEVELAPEVEEDWGE